MRPIIEVKHLTKEYRLGALQGLKQTLLNAGARISGKPISKPPMFRALDDLSFSIDRGEVVGIIGHNGAGKSTLLKILAGISTATSGTVAVNGRIAPLIEVGAGFVPDFTGRENVYLNGAIMGMSKKEVSSKLDEIVAFAEMAEFIDTPVKRYSSGMQVRLAFAVATSIESEILIVDEVLAVGDLAFQRKCFDRIEELINKQGRSVLIVSHNIRQVLRMCDRAIMLEHGKVVADGDASKVTGLFYQRSNQKIQDNQNARVSKHSIVDSSGEVELLDVKILDQDDGLASGIRSGEPLVIHIQLLVHKPLKKPEVVIGTHTTDFVYLSANSTALFDDRPDFAPGVHDIQCRLGSFPVVAGTYCIRVAIFDGNGRLVLSGETLQIFSVLPLPEEAKLPPLRSLNLSSTWLINNSELVEAQSCELT